MTKSAIRMRRASAVSRPLRLEYERRIVGDSRIDRLAILLADELNVNRDLRRFPIGSWITRDREADTPWLFWRCGRQISDDQRRLRITRVRGIGIARKTQEHLRASEGHGIDRQHPQFELKVFNSIACANMPCDFVAHGLFLVLNHLSHPTPTGFLRQTTTACRHRYCLRQRGNPGAGPRRDDRICHEPGYAWPSVPSQR